MAVPEDYKKLAPAEVAYYDGVRLHRPSTPSSPIIALPFHPSNAYTIHELQANAADILHAVQEEANKQFERRRSMDLDSKYLRWRCPCGPGRHRRLRRRYV